MMTVHQVVNVDYDMQEHTPGVYAKHRVGNLLSGFLKIFRFLERILMEDIKLICSLDSNLLLNSICSIGSRSSNQDTAN